MCFIFLSLSLSVLQMSSLLMDVFYSPAGRMVVRHCVSGGPHPFSAECELWGAGTLPGALLASCRGNSTAESQYKHMAYATVLGPDPHVRHVHMHFLQSVFLWYV